MDQKRRKVAERIADGNSMLATIIEIHLQYIRGLTPRSVHKQGIDFYILGHNASHEFHIGVKDGEIWRYVIGESNELDSFGYPKVTSKIYQGKNGLGYFGHF